MLKLRIEVRGGCVVDHKLTTEAGIPVDYECELVDWDDKEAEEEIKDGEDLDEEGLS